MNSPASEKRDNPTRSTTHCIDITRGADLRDAPKHATHPACLSFQARIQASGIKRSRRRLNIMSALATGWLPWGVEWSKEITMHGREYILCCGHTMRAKEAQAFVDAGLLMAGGGVKPSLVITDAGREWLKLNW